MVKAFSSEQYRSNLSPHINLVGKSNSDNFLAAYAASSFFGTKIAASPIGKEKYLL